MLIEALFYVFGAILIAAALGVISARNPVYSALAVIVEIVGVVWARGGLGIDAGRGATPTAPTYSNTLELGRVLYTRYAYPFELAAMLLLVAIVAAIALTMRRRAGLKQQDVSAQVAVRRADRLRIVKMDAEKRP